MLRERRAWDTANNCYWQNHSDSFLLSLEGVLMKTVSGDGGEIEAIVRTSEFKNRFVFEDKIGREDRNGHALFEGDVVTVVKTPSFEVTIQWSDFRLGWVGIDESGSELELPFGKFMELKGNIHIDQGE